MSQAFAPVTTGLDAGARVVNAISAVALLASHFYHKLCLLRTAVRVTLFCVMRAYMCVAVSAHVTPVCATNSFVRYFVKTGSYGYMKLNNKTAVAIHHSSCHPLEFKIMYNHIKPQGPKHHRVSIKLKRANSSRCEYYYTARLSNDGSLGS